MTALSERANTLWKSKSQSVPAGNMLSNRKVLLTCCGTGADWHLSGHRAGVRRNRVRPRGLGYTGVHPSFRPSSLLRARQRRAHHTGEVAREEVAALGDHVGELDDRDPVGGVVDDHGIEHLVPGEH